MVRHRVRIRFSKQGDLRWIGHRDLMRCMERLFRRAGLPLKFSEGFHPKPRMSFPSALAVGIEAAHEVMELELTEPWPADEIGARLAGSSVAGLEIRSVETIPEGARRVRVVGFRYEIDVPPARRAAAAERIAAIRGEAASAIQPASDRPAGDAQPLLGELALDGGVLRIGLRNGEPGSPTPRDLLSRLGLADLETSGGILRRTAVELATD